jgi:two-component system, sensor histidine kinase LadS
MLSLWLAAASLGSVAQAEGISADQDSIDRIEGVALLEDPQGQWTIDQVREAALDSRFKPWTAQQGLINLGYSNSVYWVRIPLQRQAQAPARWVLELPYFQLKTVDFFAPGQAPVRTGSALPLQSRPYLYPFFAFPLDLGLERQYHYLRVSSSHSVTVPLVLWQERAFLKHVQGTLILQFLYFGGLIALCVYNFFLAVSLRDTRFLLYFLFAGVFGLAMMAGNGLGQMFLWPGKSDFDAIGLAFFLSLAGAMVMLFSNRFLEAKRHAPKASLALKSLALLYLLVAALLLGSLWHDLPIGLLTQSISVLTVIAGVLVPLAAVQVLRRGKKGTRFFLLAWVVLWSGAMVAVLRAYGWVPTNGYTAYSLQISSALEMLLLALALADVVHLEREDRESAQQEALLAKQRLLDEARHAEERLEQAVQERTLQLEAAWGEQNQLLTRYVRFGALISHEFRNPLGIVDSQISLLRKQAKGLADFDKRLDIMSGATARLLSLFETWMQGDRLRQAMDAFGPQHIPLAAWLRELVDAQSLMHETHPIELRLISPVGDVWADEALLEAALLNLLDNACKYSSAGQTVGVEVVQKPGWVGIAVVDEGCGIDPKDHAAIFDDYFRVHPEGAVAGIGLGLAFVRRIVQLHEGELELASAMGQGSRFCIWLPHSNSGQSTSP